MSLSRFVVFEPPETEGPSERAVFVRDRFSLAAFLVPFVWLLRYGLWLSALAVVALFLAIGFIGEMSGSGLVTVVLSVLLSGIVALEGPMLRARRLRAKGWREAASLQAEGRAEAETIYYHSEGREAGRSGISIGESGALPWARPKAEARSTPPPIPAAAGTSGAA
ncbi:DUF2628 domain-containing protein [Aurantimonas sp. VKM B-3413]|uniref:DUF2628 domain-containing protein n=1 Tax=Aurantimonas sp. VKM B-3413 TaxID=2779401 RepID=UPI001E5765DF|nr:DUF2628 domain-containing protein [Aurantimonas sp. VKM B-3413]